jgi:hypothetical protein
MFPVFETTAIALETVSPMPQCAHSAEQLRRDVVWILQREKETFQAQISPDLELWW